MRFSIIILISPSNHWMLPPSLTTLRRSIMRRPVKTRRVARSWLLSWTSSLELVRYSVKSSNLPSYVLLTKNVKNKKNVLRKRPKVKINHQQRPREPRRRR